MSDQLIKYDEQKSKGKGKTSVKILLLDWLIGVFIDTQTFSVPTSSG